MNRQIRLREMMDKTMGYNEGFIAARVLLTEIDDDVDGDILTTSLLKSWNDVQLLLKEEGNEDAKQQFICFCHEEKNSQGIEDYQEVCLRWEVQCHGKQT